MKDLKYWKARVQDVRRMVADSGDEPNSRQHRENVNALSYARRQVRLHETAVLVRN